jgi:hypothetical protein
LNEAEKPNVNEQSQSSILAAKHLAVFNVTLLSKKEFEVVAQLSEMQNGRPHSICRFFSSKKRVYFSFPLAWASIV